MSADVAKLSSTADGLDPPERFLDPFTYSLRHNVAGVSGGSTIDRGYSVRGVLRDVRGEPETACLGDEVAGVVGLVRGDGAPPFRCWEPSKHLNGTVAFGVLVDDEVDTEVDAPASRFSREQVEGSDV